MSEKEREVGEFERWNEQKQVLDLTDLSVYFKECEVRWAYLGKNVNSEIFGKGNCFSRPVLILRKVYGHSCIVLPLTSKLKNGTYYYNFLDTCGNEYCALLTQLRYIDGVRVGDKIGNVSKKEFKRIKVAVNSLLCK